MKFHCILFTILCSLFVQAQDFSIQDLQKLEDEELLEFFNEVSNDSIKAEQVARVYLERARKEKDIIKMARGYDRLARIFHPEKNIMFADSVITLTEHLDNITYPALGYMLKSYSYFKMNNFVLETQNNLKAYELALNKNNLTQQLYISDNLIIAKATWGNKYDALKLQKSRHLLMMNDNFKNQINKSTRKGAKDLVNMVKTELELSSIKNFVFCYINLKYIDSANLYNNTGLEKSKSYVGFNDEKKYYYRWFKEASIEIDYYLENYLSVITKSNELLSFKEASNDNSTIFKIYFFKGLSYLKLNQNKSGIENLLKADSIYETNKFSLQPYQRELFEKLLDHYDSNNDITNKIKYLNKLISIDSIFKQNYQYFEPDLIRNFETPRLLQEKEVLIQGLQQKNRHSLILQGLAYGILIISLGLLGYYFKRQQLFKRKFEMLVATQEKDSISAKITNDTLGEISSNILNDILTGLDHFEKNKQFLSQKISLISLAEKLGTNSRYLSKVINFQKDKNFPQYINDLRVDFALKELRDNPKFKKFTIKAIAAECGFKGAESFSKAFFKKHGIYPSYYIKRLINTDNKRKDSI